LAVTIIKLATSILILGPFFRHYSPGWFSSVDRGHVALRSISFSIFTIIAIRELVLSSCRQSLMWVIAHVL
jgi:hypothetical protein